MFELISNLLVSYPITGLVLVSIVVTLASTLVYKYATDQDVMKSLKEETKMLSEEAKKAKDDPKKMIELNKRVMEKNMDYMRHSFKPMIITIVPFGLFFIWLSKIYSDIGPIISSASWLSWFWLYVIFSIVLSIVLRKILKVY